MKTRATTYLQVCVGWWVLYVEQYPRLMRLDLIRQHLLISTPSPIHLPAELLDEARSSSPSGLGMRASVLFASSNLKQPEVCQDRTAERRKQINIVSPRGRDGDRVPHRNSRRNWAAVLM